MKSKTSAFTKPETAEVEWFTVVKKENLSKLFIMKFSEPLFAAVFSWILLGA